jgi:hypothetical protein
MSYISENKTYLQSFPQLIRYLDGSQLSSYLSISETPEKLPTLRYEKDQQSVYLHDTRHPLQEAKNLIGQFAHGSDHQHVLFYGVGLGYHIDEFVQKYPSIYEPDGNIFHFLLTQRSIRNWNQRLLRNIYLERSPAECPFHLKNFIDKSSGKVLVVALPSYKQIFKERAANFSNTLEKMISRKKINLHISRGFQRNWTENCIENFPHTLSTPNVLRLKDNPFQERPAILVAAGPSLDDELEVLKVIKNKGLAYIFSVGSAINTLVENDIYPDAAFTYDPSPHNVNVFQKIIDRNITTIPLIFGTSVDLQTIKQYPGPKLHMITSQDSLSRYLLRQKENQGPDFVNDASSIAVVALQVLFRMGCSLIMLVGQNCAYRDNKHYASGIDYAKSLTERELSELVMVEGVHGNPVATSPSMNLMREEIQTYIKMFPQREVINTTKEGAQIAGAPFEDLQALLDDRLLDPVAAVDWSLQQSVTYDRVPLKANGDQLTDHYRMLGELFQSLMSLLFEIELAAKRGRTDRLKELLDIFDGTFKDLQKNVCFQVNLLPMNQVEYEVLYGQIETLRLESNIIQKAHKLVDMFGDFVLQCRDDYVLLRASLENISDKINAYSGGYHI